MHSYHEELKKSKRVNKKAWQMDREMRLNAIPLDRRLHPSRWEETSQSFPQGDELMLLF